MARIVCDYCGTEYDGTMQRCPLCGTVNELREENVPEAELPAGPKREKKRTGAHEAPNQDKIPKWLSILICIILGIAVVVGALYAMYALGIFSPKGAAQNSQDNLTLPIEDQQESDGAEPEDSNLENKEPADIVCTDISVSPASTRLEAAGISFTAIASVQPVDCTDPVSWSSSDTAVCTVGDDGTITAVGEGTAIVTAACGAFTATIEVECSFASSQVNHASLDLTDFTLFSTGEQATIHVVDAPEGAVVAWTSSNTNVCTVSNGTVTAVKAGTATVTADVNGKKLECIVRCNIEGSVVANDENAEVIGGYELDHKDVTLGIGESFEISVVGGVSGGWSVTDSSVIAVDGNGIVTAVGTGNAYVYTVVGGQRLECIVRVV